MRSTRDDVTISWVKLVSFVLKIFLLFFTWELIQIIEIKMLFNKIQILPD
jgi:hypothetical protein